MKKHIIVPVFECGVTMFYGEDEIDRFAKCCKERLGFDFDEPQGMIGYTVGSIFYVKNPDVGIIAHELMHVIRNLVRFKQIDDNNGEVEAYLMSYLLPRFTKAAGII